jgi:adenylate cyclase
LLLAAAIAAALVGGLVSWTGVLARIERSTIDARLAIRGHRAPGPVVVVGIDSTSLVVEPRWPWPRSLQGRLVTALAGLHPRLIVYDIQITEPTTPAEDLALYNAVSRARPVVMVTTEVGPHGATRILGGNANLRAAGALPASALLPADADGEIRSLTPSVTGLPTVAVVVARLLGRRVTLTGNERALIDYPGGAGAVPEIPAASVLNGRAGAAGVRGRVAVVGLVAPTLGDVHATDAGGGALLSGPEIQADAIATVLAGLPLRGAPGWLVAALVLLGAIVAPAVAARRSAVAATLAALVWLALFLVAAQLAFNGGTVLQLMPVLAATLTGTAGAVVADLATVRRERAQLRRTFERFVPPEHVGRVVDRAEGGAGLGDELDATVLFCDLRGFTTFAEGHAPDAVLTALNRYLQRVSDAVMDHGGTVVSFLGDGVMAVFGAPLESKDHAVQALAAAQAIVSSGEADRVAGALPASGSPGAVVGVGLASGAVLSGTVGSGRRMEYAAIGDTTNVAARVQELTKELGHNILMTDATRARLSEDANVRRVGERRLRGREAPTVLWTTV